MQMPRRKQRELLFQLLFSWEVAEGFSPELIMESLEVSKKNVFAMQSKLEDVVCHIKTLDDTILKASHAYALERISLVDKTVLRLALFELLFDKEEVKIVIDEALRLTKKFSSPEAVSYVHAIIDEVFKNEGAPTPCLSC